MLSPFPVMGKIKTFPSTIYFDWIFILGMSALTSNLDFVTSFSNPLLDRRNGHYFMIILIIIHFTHTLLYKYLHLKFHKYRRREEQD